MSELFRHPQAAASKSDVSGQDYPCSFVVCNNLGLLYLNNRLVLFPPSLVSTHLHIFLLHLNKEKHIPHAQLYD